MAGSYSVTAKLTAVDGMSGPMRSAAKSMEQLKSSAGGVSGSMDKASNSPLKMGLAFGAMAGIGATAFNAVKSGIVGLVSEMNQSSIAWKTFEGNMKILGKTDSQIKTAKKSMQDYAAKTIYSASDMGSAYAQLEAVGVKGTGKLVKGFGGLAAAADDPKQAMKSLTQQGIQMASKPMVQWADFRIMLEQAPTGMAAVAKHMGMSTDQLIAKIQDGTLKSKDFLKALSETGNQKGFQGMAESYKSVGQALSGLAETISIKFGGAFDAASAVAIKAISSIIDWISKLDFSKIGSEISSVFGGGGISTMLGTAKGLFTNFATAVGTIMSGVWSVISAIPWGTVFSALGVAVTIVMGALSGLFGFIGQHQEVFKTLAAGVTIFILAFAGIQAVIGIVTTVISVISTIGTIVSSVIGFFTLLGEVGAAAFAIIASPVTLVVAAIAGIIAILVLAYNKVGWFRDMVNAAWTAIVAVATTVWNGIVSVVTGVMTSIWAGIQPIITQIKALWQSLQPIIAVVWSGISTVISAAFAVISAIFSSMMPIISAIWSTAWNVMSTILSTVWTVISTVVSTALAVITGIITAVMAIINGDWSGAWEAIKGVLSAVWNAIVTIVTTLITALVSIISSVLSGIASLWSAIWNGIKSVASAVWSGIVSIVSGFINAVMSVITGVMASITGAWSAAWNGIKSVASGIWNGIVGAFQAIIGKLVGHAQNIINKVKSVFNGLKNFSLADAGRAIIDSFLSGLTAAYGKVKSFVSGIASWIKKHKGPISYDKKLLIPAGNAIMTGLNRGLQAEFKTVQSSVSAMAGKIATAATVALPSVDSNGFSNSLSSINAGLNRSNLSAELNQNYTGSTVINTSVQIDGNEVAKATSDKITNIQNQKTARQSRLLGSR